jgi:arachidonate 15-lipoxygenase
MAELQMELGYMLGTVHYSALGNYDEGTFEDARVLDALKQFQEHLANIELVIAERNKKRRPYEFLVPSGVPQSINI